MAHRTFRLSIHPEDTPEVRRVIELDGRSSLTELHREIARAFGLEPGKELYAFFLSGRFWDAATAFLDPRAEGKRADKALLFRLGLEAGRSFAYLLGFKRERRFVVSVETVKDVSQALPAPALIEAAGDYREDSSVEAPTPEKDPPELAVLVTFAEAFLDADDELDPFAAELAVARARVEPWEHGDEALDDPARLKQVAQLPAQELSDAIPIFEMAAAAALTLLEQLGGDVETFLKLDEWLLSRALGTRLLDLPSSLALVGETELALKVAHACRFIDPELVQGDIAVILGRAGRRDEALAVIERLLDGARDASLVEAKAGDTYRALGDAAAAEAYYRRALSVATTASDRLHALLRLVTCLTDTGRDAEANELLQQARQARGEPAAKPATAVGRNDPCPCGSGKKYKKCHGV